MSMFPLIEDSDQSPELAKVYEEIKAVGMNKDKPLNWFTAMGLRPDILQVCWSVMQTILLNGMLPSTIKQMIATLISARNNCNYCLMLHSSIITAMGVPPQIVEALSSSGVSLNEIPPPQRAILAFALKVDADPKSISDKDFEILKDFGLSDEEIIEIIVVTAFIRFSNTWADASRIRTEIGEGVT